MLKDLFERLYNLSTKLFKSKVQSDMLHFSLSLSLDLKYNKKKHNLILNKQTNVNIKEYFPTSCTHYHVHRQKRYNVNKLVINIVQK